MRFTLRHVNMKKSKSYTLPALKTLATSYSQIES